MTPKQVDVRYRYQTITAKPLYISNDDVRRVAADVRGQSVQRRGGRMARLGTRHCDRGCWSTDYPVTNEQDEAVLGVCEYDHRGMPDTALISVNPHLTRDNDGLLLGTLAHELGHAIRRPGLADGLLPEHLAWTPRRLDPPCLSCGDNR